jgi:predicted TIM-barrel fold metal-dependent hydrolase
MIIDISCYPTQVVDLAWQHAGEPFTGEKLLAMMDKPYYVNGKPRRIDKAFIQPPQGNTIYTWTDGEGKVHYGAKPPPNMPAKELKEGDSSLSTVRSSELRAGEQELLRELQQRE